MIHVHIVKTGGTSVRRALGLGEKVHRTVGEIRAVLPDDEWEAAYKFAFVRNPFDKVVSQYLYRVRKNRTHLRSRPMSFPDWVRLTLAERDPRYRDVERPFLPQTEWLDDGSGGIAVDFVGRFERLEEDFAILARELGVEADLPWLNASERGPYRDYYTPEATEIVREAFSSDLAEFGYEF